MNLLGLLHNPPLLAALVAWTLAQTIKPFLERIDTGKWNWGLFFSSGGHAVIPLSADHCPHTLHWLALRL